MPNLRVLVVEDDAVQRLTLCAWLATIEGLHVIAAAASGSEALAELEKTQPDLVLTDVQMPGIDGFELAQRITRRKNPPRVVIMSSSDGPGYPRLAVAVGAETFIHKHSLRPGLAKFLKRQFGFVLDA